MSLLRFRVFYFLYFGAVGTMVPYFGLYLDSIGVDAYGIGLFLSVTTSVKIFAPPLWAWLCDRSQRPLVVVRRTGFAALLCFILLLTTSSYGALLVAMTGFNFFWTAQLPQFDAVALRRLGLQRTRYGRLRLWGSLGFVVAVVVSGALIDRFGVKIILWILAALYVATYLTSIGAKDRIESVTDEPIVAVAWRPSVATLLFLLMGFLMQASHGPFYAFFSIHLTELGYAANLLGVLWAFGVVCEVGIFFVMHRVFEKFGVVTVLSVSFAVAVVRWLLLGYASDQLTVLILTQALHGITFGAWHAASMQFIYLHFPDRMQHRGQALHGSLCFALGTAAGGYCAGVVWQQFGATGAFVWAAATAALALIASLPMAFSIVTWSRR